MRYHSRRSPAYRPRPSSQPRPGVVARARKLSSKVPPWRESQRRRTIRASPKSSTSRSTTAADSSSHSQIGTALSPVSARLRLLVSWSAPVGSWSVLALQRGLALLQQTLGLVEVALVRQLGVLAQEADVVVGDGD